MNAATIRVDGEKLFWEPVHGCRRNGLVKIVSGGQCCVGGIFRRKAKGTDGRMLTGRNTGIADDDGKRCTFYFNTLGIQQGELASAEKRMDSLYYNGLLVTADGDSQ